MKEERRVSPPKETNQEWMNDDDHWMVVEDKQSRYRPLDPDG